jgi:ribosome-binding factor A
MPKKTPHTKRLEEGGGMHHFRDALAAVLAERIEFPRGSLVTVMDAKVTRDTLHAKCVISVLPISMEAEAVRVLVDQDREIKQGLSQKLRLRRIPRLHWVFNEAEAYVGEIDDTINQLKKQGEL